MYIWCIVELKNIFRGLEGQFDICKKQISGEWRLIQILRLFYLLEVKNEPSLKYIDSLLKLINLYFGDLENRFDLKNAQKRETYSSWVPNTNGHSLSLMMVQSAVT